MDILGQVAPVVLGEAAKYISKKTTLPADELAASAAKNDTTAIRKQLDRDPYVNRGPALVVASSAGYLSSLDLLLEPTAPALSSKHRAHEHEHHNQKIDLDVWASGTTPLLAAVRNHHCQTAKFLLEEGADPDLCPKSGITALQEASQSGDLDIVRVLLLYGAKVNHQDHVGDTPLIVACRWGHAHTARCLLQNGARINEVNDKGSSALSVAAKHHNVDAVEELLDEKWEKGGVGREGRGRGRGVNVNARDRKGRTPLHRAVEGIWLLEGVGSDTKEEVVKLLLDKGADPRIRDKEGKTPGDRAGWLSGGDGLRKLLEEGRRASPGRSRVRAYSHSRATTF
ncbi:hypothetical protein EG329_002371 [Mollisiaceae sp. DMI_Dod_QoI]|nr:hypothetical protein EG329_002371 [Helotiales sp. DMI_Dod_QoI]